MCETDYLCCCETFIGVLVIAILNSISAAFGLIVVLLIFINP